MRIVLLLLIAFVDWATGQNSGDLRLVQDGIALSSYTRGRLELYFNGRWGTVCDDHWSSTETRVACHQLGLSNASTSWTTSSDGGYGPAAGTIWLVNVRCSGSESRLISCPRTVFESHNCSHSDDVAIDCSFDGDLRLVQNGNSSSSNTHGRLEVYYSGQWGTVCQDSWSSINTRVACRQLGFSLNTSWTTSSAGGYGTATGTIWLDNVRCSGSESKLISCQRNYFGSHNCFHSQDVAIDCKAPRTGDLRLVQNGNSSSSNTRGRLEVYYSGRWGTVCDDLWSSTNTRVACRQLGLSTTSTGWTTSSAGGYGSTTGTIWLDNVRCSGSELKLSSCQTNILGSNDCSHSEDVAIECTGGPDIGTVWVVVGVSVASFVLFVIIPTICIIIVRIMRRRTTAVPSTTTVTRNSQRQTAKQPTAQQFDFQAYPAAATDLKQAPPPAYEMHTAYPAPSLTTSSQKQPKQAPPPTYEMQATPPPPPLTSSSQQQPEQAQPPTYEIQPTPTPSSITTTTSISTEV